MSYKFRSHVAVHGYATSLALLTIFVMLPLAHASATQILHSFEGGEGADPFGNLLLIDDWLYGTTSQGGLFNQGTIFRSRLDGDQVQVLHHFGSEPGDGANSFGGLVSDGMTLYGTTRAGGATPGPLGNGIVFAINHDGSGYRVVHSFELADGARSEAGLVFLGPHLYGTTSAGGAYQGGTVFSLTTDGGDFRVLHDFSRLLDGASPLGGLAVAGERLYGTTFTGGPIPARTRGGTVYGMDPDGAGFEILHSFTRLDGAYSGADLTIVADRMFGTTLYGGQADAGVVFTLGVDGSDFEVLREFTGADGARPGGAVTIIGNRLYGTSAEGGDFGVGTVFSMAVDGSEFATRHHFSGAPLDGNGPVPLGGFAIGGQQLYGTTMHGGTEDAGTLFAFVIPEPASRLLIVAAAAMVAVRRSRRRIRT